MAELAVRVMRPEEWTVARAVSVEAFGGDESIGVLLDVLRESWAWDDDLAFVATRDDEVVGFVLFTSAFVDAPDRVVDVLVLSPLAVRSDLQRQGIGSSLVTHALGSLASRPEALVFLEGVPAFYPRLGFRSASSLGFTAPSTRIPDAAFMAYPLPAYDPSVRGALVYADAFWRADAVGLRE
jgi:putative acetyltransferase